MDYIGRVPAPPLDRFIDDVYCLSGVPDHRRVNVPPMPSAHLFVNLGGPVRLWDADPSVPPADWSALAHPAGYFDQAHLAKEFKEFTGHTPTEHLALRRRVPTDQGFPPMPAD